MNNLAPGISAALDLEPCQIHACLDVIEARQEQSEIAAGMPPRSQRVTPELAAVFGTNARMASPAELAGMFGGLQ